MSTSRSQSFTSAFNHAAHIQRIYQYLIDEIKVFEKTWGREDCYEGNLFLQDMHIALIYLNDEMKFRDSPEDQPYKGRAPLDPRLVNLAQRYNGPQYEPTFASTIPYESPVYMPKTDENMFTCQATSSHAIASPSHARITSEVDCSAGEARQHLFKEQGRVTPYDEAIIHPGVVSTDNKYHSYKGKEHEFQSDGVPYQNEDEVVVKTEPTEPIIPEDNDHNTATDVDSHFLHQSLKRTHSPPNHSPVYRSSIHRSTPHSYRMPIPTTREIGYSIHYYRSREYPHCRTPTFDPPRSATKSRYEAHAVYRKRNLSEEVEERYTRSRKRSRRN